MSVEDRTTKLESGVGHLRSNVMEIKADIRDLRSELGIFRKEVGAELASLRKDLGTETAAIKADLSTFKLRMATFQTDVAKEFGSVRVLLERNKLWMLVTGVATILTMITTAVTLVHVLKL